MTRRSRRLLDFLPLIAVVIAVEACRSPSGINCTDIFIYGLGITVVDSVTSNPPASALLIARSGTFMDSVGPITPFQLNGAPSLVLSTAGERAGTYDVTVRSSGYRDWIRSGINVTADACHVRSVAVTARLQR